MLRHAVLLVSAMLLAGCQSQPAAWSLDLSEGGAVLALRQLDVREFTDNFPVVHKSCSTGDGQVGSTEMVFTRQGARSFCIRELTDSMKVGSEDRRAEIIIYENKKVQSILDIKGFKAPLEARWIGEEVLEVESWPGRCVQLIELVNVTTGKVIYKSALGVYPDAAH
jgi:hypothetical protein